ncbi:hypothetical protein FRB95_002936 [Tulasnella sp. JGI-2019a]|nr:hypothetical protein FRB95_002936 [Tulasnella sp. JGI-2019a]
MCKQFLLLQEAIAQLLQYLKYLNSEAVMLNTHQLTVLQDIVEVLRVPFWAQEVLSSERTPTLPMALPTYKIMLDAWQSMEKRYPNLRHAIRAGLQKIEEYMSKARKSKIYMLALILNPMDKMSWIEDSWKDEMAVADAKKTVEDAMLDYRRAAISQGSALSKLRGIANNLKRGGSSSDTASSSGSPWIAPVRSEAELEEEDRRIVASVLSAYLADTTVTSSNTTTHILMYWELNSARFPLLASIALDVLPVQASSVPCERVFSSSKETTTLRRSNLSPNLMSTLQELKFQFKQERLDFVSHLCTKEDFLADKITPEEVQDLLDKGKLDELEDLLQTGHM